MKTIVFLFTFLFLSVTADAKPDKYAMHCSVMSFLDQLELIDTSIEKTIYRGIREGRASYEGQTGSLCYKIYVFSDRENTNISVTLIEKEIEYGRLGFNFRKGKLDATFIRVLSDKGEYSSHFYVRGSKKNSYYRRGEGKNQDFSVALFEEHLRKVTPLME